MREEVKKAVEGDPAADESARRDKEREEKEEHAAATKLQSLQRGREAHGREEAGGEFPPAVRLTTQGCPLLLHQLGLPSMVSHRQPYPQICVAS